MIARLIINRFDVLRLTYADIPYSAEHLPVMWLTEQMSISWSSPGTVKNIPNLLQCERLPEIVHIRDFNTGDVGNTLERERWRDLILHWAQDSRKINSVRVGAPTRLCIIAKLKDFDFAPPSEQEGLSVHWWWGFPSSLEMRLACRMGDQESHCGEAASRWLEQVLPALAGNDIKLAEHLWGDIFGSSEEIFRSLKEFASIENTVVSDGLDIQELGAQAILSCPPNTLWLQWSKGQIVSTLEYGIEYHPALLASCGRRRDIEHRLWRGQAELLLPILNEIRIRVCDDLTEIFGRNWPIEPIKPRSEYELEAVRDNPRGAEFGYIEYLLKRVPEFRTETGLLPLVSQCRDLRNEIAHYRPVNFMEFKKLWEENERLLKTAAR